MAIGLPYKKVGASSASVGLVGEIHTVQMNPLGTTTEDDLGNEWIYLPGVAGCLEGDFVIYNPGTLATTRAAGATAGGVAIAPAAIISGWGWFMMAGFYPTANCTTVAGVAGLFVSATPGAVQSASSATNMIYGAMSAAAGVSNKVGVRLFTPFVTAVAPA